MCLCSIKLGSGPAQVLHAATMLIWDEAPMSHKHNYEALDRSLRDLMGVDAPFGGKVVVFGGDFRQVLPVVPRGTRSDITAASLSKASFWGTVCVKRLSVNMRVKSLLTAASAGAAGAQKQAQVAQGFADTLLRIGDGTEETFGDR